MADKKLIVITGATGSGKTSIRDYLVEKYHAGKIITHTTRKPRGKEQNNVDYYFETDESFAKLHLLEHVKYVTAQYGSSMEGINKAFENHDVAVIVLDTEGAITYARKLKDQAEIWFIKVDDPDTLRQRMQKRGDESQRIEKRLASDEFMRDMHLPDVLKNVATVIDNNDWQVAQKQVDNLMTK